MERDNYIDFLRGIAAVWIIFIHTCFWSGGSYVPELMQTFSLAVDVPFFFFLSGWASTYVCSFRKSILSLLGIYKKYIMFMPFLVIALLVTGLFTGQFPGLTLRTLYGNLFFFTPDERNILPAVLSSMWFMPVYFTVVPLGQAILASMRTVSGAERWNELLIAGLALLYSYWTGSFFLIPSRILFYLFFYLLGVACKDFYIERFRVLVVFGLADICAMKLIGISQGWDVSNMQSMKFPPDIVYLLYSLLWIAGVLWAKKKLPKISAGNVFCRIGRAAILFYFCQGISSSLLFYIVPGLHMYWGIKLFVAFAINLSVTLLLVWTLKHFYSFEGRLADAVTHLLRSF